MPKILINEKDYTSPGSASRYANHAILITGLEAECVRLAKKSDDGKANPTKGDPISGRLPLYRLEAEKDPETWELTGKYEVVYNRPVKPDDNGVYEFSSAEDFEKTIGLVPPKFVNETGVINYHYGNQMAYELLKLGYPIFYKSLNPTTHEYPEIDPTFAGTGEPDVLEENEANVEIVDPCAGIKEMRKESFWAAFKDKASYDFRFITHGLLESSPNAKDVETSSDYITAETAKTNAKNELDALDALAGILVTETGSEEFDSVSYADENNNEYKNKLDSAYVNLIEQIRTANENDPRLTFLTTKSKARTTEVRLAYENFMLVWNALVGENEKTIKAKKTTLEKAIEEYETTLYELTNQCISNSDIHQVNAQIAALAKYEAGGLSGSTTGLDMPSRGDCVALIELDEVSYRTKDSIKPEIKIVEEIFRTSGVDNQYCALTVPSVVYKMSANKAFDNNKKFPGAFHYLACYAYSLGLGFAEWYAVAGYTRGVSSLTIDYTTVKLGEIAINTLEPRYKDDISNADKLYPKFACNVIANFRGSYYLWGNRTCFPIGKKGNPKNGDLVASSFLNIRQLCSTLKKQLYVSCRQFTFDPNSDTLWFNFINAIKPTLDEMKADQGIRDYMIVKEFTDKKATLKARIRIIPIEAVEDFDLEVSLEDSFGGETAVSVAG